MSTPAVRIESSTLRSLRSDSIARCRRKFLSYFPGGFRDADYIATEREYKWAAHKRWHSQLSLEDMRRLVAERGHAELARRAIAIESRTNLLFSFEKMAIRDAVRSRKGATRFANGLLALLEDPDPNRSTFEDWIEVVRGLPVKQTRVLTWPLLTVFPFLAQPSKHVFLKPNVTRQAAKALDFDFSYRSKPSFETYGSLLDFARRVRGELRDLRPRDMIDIQSFLWVQGSDEYPG